MRIKVQEFISAEDSGELIHGDRNQTRHDQITSKSTTDQHVAATRQAGMSIGNQYASGYQRTFSEDVLPFSEDADRMQEQPEEFRKFLQDKGMEDSFPSYFTPVPEKSQALKMAEAILAKRRESTDVIDKTPLPTIDEVKGEHKLIMDKFEKIASFIKENMSPQQKTVILNHFNSLING